MKKIILLISFFVITIINADGVIKENNQTKDKNSSAIFLDMPESMTPKDTITPNQASLPSILDPIFPNIAPYSNYKYIF